MVLVLAKHPLPKRVGKHSRRYAVAAAAGYTASA